jgi:hypothetical protein
MLRARSDTAALNTTDECGEAAGDECRLGAEGADADDRVVRVRVDIGDRREIEVDADRREIGPDRSRDLLGQRWVVDDAECPVPGIRAAGSGLEPRDVAAVLIGRDEDVAARGAERCRQLARLLGALDVRREQDDAPEPTLDPAQAQSGGVRHRSRQKRQAATVRSRSSVIP